VASRQRRDNHPTNVYLLSPVEFCRLRRSNTQAGQNGSHTSGVIQRVRRRRSIRAKALHRARAEMIEVIVRNENDIDGWQVFKQKRWREENALGQSIAPGAAVHPTQDR